MGNGGKYMSSHCDIRTVRTKLALCEAMGELLQTMHFDDVTVHALCARSAVSRSTFYLHYRDKYDLATDCICRLFTPMPDDLCEERLEDYFYGTLAAVEENDALIRQLRKFNESMELKWNIDDHYKKAFMKYYEANLQKGARYEDPLELMAVYNCNGVMQLILWWHAMGYVPDKEIVARYLAKKIRQSGKAY